MSKINCKVYVACRMTGRSKREQVERARYMCQVLKAYNLTPISPVLEENIQPEDAILVQTTDTDLAQYWARDKEIMSYEAHVTLMDGGDEGSVGMGREYGFNRYALWKPTITLWSQDRGITVAQFEDDAIFLSAHEAAAYIAVNFGTRWKRWKWRLKMLRKSIPTFLKRQGAAWD
jgi:hypothetical protein